LSLPLSFLSCNILFLHQDFLLFICSQLICNWLLKYFMIADLNHWGFHLNIISELSSVNDVFLFTFWLFSLCYGKWFSGMNLDIPRYCIMRLWVLFKPIAVVFDSALEGKRWHCFISARREASYYFSLCDLH
jgi:hypothetical protein